jgi:hypothetical protein
MKFNRKKFFDVYRIEFGELTQAQVNGLEQLLSFIESDRYVTTVEVAAFLLGTTKHEAADTYKPIHEYGGKAYFIKRYGGQTRKGKELGNDTPEEGYDYAGKGYPQTTGESNYERLEDALRIEYPEIIADFERRTGKRFDLTVGDQPNDKSDPQNMLDPAIAYVSMSYGSRVGLFTGRKLSQYDLKTDVGRKGSRRIINGQDKATLIAGYIAQFIKILKASKVSGSTSTQSASPTAPSITPTDKPPEASMTPTNIETDVVQNADTIINEESLVDKASGLGDKFQSFQGVLDKFGFSVDNAKRSLGTVLLTWFKAIGSALMVVGSVLLDHWELLIIAALLAVLAYLLWERSGVRVAEAKAGIPVDVAKEMIKQENK